jgi:hypothetical protein
MMKKILRRNLKKNLRLVNSDLCQYIEGIYGFFLALTGIDILELINDKISKLDRALRSVDTPSDASKNQALVTSERLRADAIQNGLFLFDTNLTD